MVEIKLISYDDNNGITEYFCAPNGKVEEGFAIKIDINKESMIHISNDDVYSSFYASSILPLVIDGYKNRNKIIRTARMPSY